MSDIGCPWCDLELPFETLVAESATCPECHTTWRYEEDDEVELPIAA